MVGGALIDGKQNVYLSAEDGIRKFSRAGQTLWHYKPPGPVPACGSIMDGAVYGNTVLGTVFAIDMETGKQRWLTRPDASAGMDTAYVEAHDGVVVTGLKTAPGGGGNTRLYGLNATNGDQLWVYSSDKVLWNVMAVFPGDGSFVVMNTHGGVQRHALHSGRLLWGAPAPEVSSQSFSDGGVILGPDGTSYTCCNYQGTGNSGEKGALRAYRLSDGHMLWAKTLDRPCNSWPAVSGDNSMVVVPTGAFVASPISMDMEVMARRHIGPQELHNLSISLGERERRSFGMPNITAVLQAFDPASGTPQWSFEFPPYGRVAARGDEEGVLARTALGIWDQCLPAQFSSPTFSSDGTVYVGRADGKLWAVGDKNGDGTISPETEVATFDTQAGFLHPGTSFAPGTMAVTSCDSLFVWNV